MSTPSFTVEALAAGDYAAWLELAQGYKTFYETSLPESAYQNTWQRIQRGDGVGAWCARSQGQLLGITHFLFHASSWSADVCYLQDLFTASDVRGKGVARALIEAVADWARERKCPRVYWQTQDSNATARLLYDKVAVNRGFIRYDIDLA